MMRIVVVAGQYIKVTDADAFTEEAPAGEKCFDVC